MITESLVPSFGVFGIGGAVAFGFGSVMLMDSDLPAYRVSLPLIAAFVTSSAAIFIFSVGAALRAREGPVVSGREAMVGAEAIAIEDFRPVDDADREAQAAASTPAADASDGAPATSGWHGHVRLMGEIWQAHSEAPVAHGAALEVTALRGLVVDVAPHPSGAAATGRSARSAT
jgi:membrane-bound serine protease (ClpP class)